MRFKVFALAVSLILITLAFSARSFSQDSAPTPSRGPRLSPLDPDDHEDEQHAKIEKDMAKKANRERQAQLQRDTDNLLKLANELKEYVEKSNENTLSVDVVKKAEQIEKLAHSVKEKMKSN